MSTFYFICILEFVKRYIVRGCYYSNGFYDGQILMTEAGTPLTVQVTPGMFNKNDEDLNLKLH